MTELIDVFLVLSCWQEHLILRGNYGTVSRSRKLCIDNLTPIFPHVDYSRRLKDVAGNFSQNHITNMTNYGTSFQKYVY